MRPVVPCETCGKLSYPTVGAVIRQAVRKARRNGVTLRYYECPRGHGWHLTSKTYREERK